MNKRRKQVKIKECSLADASIIAKLDYCYIECPWNEEMIIDAMQNGLYLFLKAEENEQVLGYGSVQIILDEAEVCNIAVFEEHRNKGVGKSILNSIITYCKSRCVKKIFLEVSETNVVALRLYEKLGFSRVGVRENYYKSGNAIVMSLNL